jgi:photosystem II stability/assembly factor-like uncharacterized protein
MRTNTLLVVAAICGLTPRLEAQWIAQSSGTDAEFRGLSAVSPTVVWASGTKGRFARTTDGGTTWKVDTVPGATNLDFRDVQALNEKTAWLMSAGEAERGLAKIYMTNDGGAHWELVYSTDLKGAFFDAISFWDAQHGIAISDPVDGRFVLVTSDDGGKSWTRVPPEGIPEALTGEAMFAASGTSITVQGSSTAWIGTGGGEKARVFRSTDRGRTWIVAETPVHAGLGSTGIFSVAFRDANHGVVVGGDYQQARGSTPNVAITSDGGRTWRLAKGPLPPGFMSGVTYVPGAVRVADTHSAANAAALVAVGLAGTARSDDGGESWTMVDTVAYNSVAFAARNAGWAVGPRGRIAKWSGVLPTEAKKED